MSARHLCWLLNALLVLAAVWLAVAGAILLVAPRVGEPLITSWTVITHGSGLEVPLNPSSGIQNAQLALNSGELIVQFDTWPSWLLRLVDYGVMSVLILGVLWLLRGFATDVHNHMPFGPKSSVRLRWIGWLLIAFPLWQLIQGALWEVLVLTQLTPAQEGVSLVSSLGRADTGDLQLQPVINPGFAVAGLILLAVAEAFRVGISLREDSEEIV